MKALPSHSRVRGLIASLAMLAACGVGQAAEIPPPASGVKKAVPAYESKQTLPHLSAPETQRLRDIVHLAMRSDTLLLGAVHGEFQRLLAKGTTATTPKSEIRDRLIGVSIVDELYVYRDALAALQSGRPTRSADRAAYEAHLASLRLASPAMLAHGDSLVASVAARDSVHANGRAILYDEKLLQSAIASLERAQARVDSLFAGP